MNLLFGYEEIALFTMNIFILKIPPYCKMVMYGHWLLLRHPYYAVIVSLFTIEVHFPEKSKKKKINK